MPHTAFSSFSDMFVRTAHALRSVSDTDEDVFVSTLDVLKQRCQPSSLKDEVELFLTFERENAFLLAEQAINEYIASIANRKVVTDSVIGRMGPNDFIDFYQAAVSCNTSLEVDPQMSQVTTTGMAKDVGALCDRIREISFEFREAETLAKQTIWQWARFPDQFVNLPLRTSRALEKEYELKRRGSSSFMLYGEPMMVSFSDLTFRFGEVEGRLRRSVTRKETELPPEWTRMDGESWKRIALEKFTREYCSVVEHFRRSGPAFFRILSVERVQNPSLYQQYMIKKKDVEQHFTSPQPVERELFHGTSEEDAKKICAHGFDRGFAGKNATLYGKGSYFAVDSSFSTNYSSDGSGRGYMFLARVLTGDYCKGNSSLKAPPVKDTRNNRLYDSVVDDVTNPSIFVVFKDSSVYPSYLITFI